MKRLLNLLSLWIVVSMLLSSVAWAAEVPRQPRDGDVAGTVGHSAQKVEMALPGDADPAETELGEIEQTSPIPPLPVYDVGTNDGLQVGARTDESTPGVAATAGRLLFAPTIDADGDPASNPVADSPVPVVDLLGQVGGIVTLAAQLEPENPVKASIGVPVTFRLWNEQGVQFEETVRSDAWGAVSVEIPLADIGGEFAYQASAPGYGQTEVRRFGFDAGQVSYALHADGAQLWYWQGVERTVFTMISPVPLQADRDEATLVIARQPDATQSDTSLLGPVFEAVDEAGLGLPFPSIPMRIVGTYTATIELQLPPGEYGVVGSLAVNATPAEHFFSQPKQLSIDTAAKSPLGEAIWASQLEYEPGKLLVQYAAPEGQVLFDLVDADQVPEIRDDWDGQNDLLKIWRTGPFEWQEERYQVDVETIVDDGKKVASLADFDYDPIARRYTLAIKSLQDQAVTDTLRVDVLGPGDVVIHHQETQVVLEPGRVLHYSVEVAAELGQPQGLRVTLDDPLIEDIRAIDAAIKRLWSVTRIHGTLSASISLYIEVLSIKLVEYLVTIPPGTGQWKTDLADLKKDPWGFLKKLGGGILDAFDFFNFTIDLGGAGVQMSLDAGIAATADLGKCPDPEGVESVKKTIKSLAERLDAKIKGSAWINENLTTGSIPIYFPLSIWGRATLSLRGKVSASNLTIKLTASGSIGSSLRVGIKAASFFPTSWLGSTLKLHKIAKGIQTAAAVAELVLNVMNMRVPQEDCDPDPPDRRPPDERQDVWQGIESFYQGQNSDETIDNLSLLIQQAQEQNLARAERLLTLRLREAELARFSSDLEALDGYYGELDTIMTAAQADMDAIISGTLPISPSQTITEALTTRAQQAMDDVDALPFAREQQQMLDAVEVAERAYLELQGQELELQHELRELFTADTVGVVAAGFAEATLSALAAAGLPSQLVSLWPSGGEFRGQPAPYFAPELAPRAMVVPSGALHTIANSPEGRDWLEAYVSGGGLLVAFTQAFGNDWEALPGGQVSGVGYEQDRRWQHATVETDVRSDWLAWMGIPKPDIQVDGAFTTWPADANILLRRTFGAYAGSPVMIEYPYGEGTVLATAAYGDWAWQAGFWWGDDWQMTRTILSRAYLLARGQDVADAFAADPASTVTVSFPITNTGVFTTSQVEVVLPTRLGWWGGDYREVVPLSLAPGESGWVDATFSTPPVRRGVHSWTQVGLYHLQVAVQDVNGDRYGVSGPFVYVRSPVVPPPLTTRLEVERATANLYQTVAVSTTVRNDTTVTRTVTISNQGDLPSAWITLTVPPAGLVGQDYTLFMDGSKRLRAAFYDEDGKRISLHSTHINVLLPNLSAEPALPSSLSSGAVITMTVRNKPSYRGRQVGTALNASLALTLTDPSGVIVWSDARNLPVLAAEQNTEQYFTLALPPLELGAYRLLYRVDDGHGLSKVSSVILPSQATTSLTLDSYAGYRVREPFTLTVQVQNQGHFDLEPLVELTVPDLTWSYTQSLTLPVEGLGWAQTFVFTMPETIQGGSHEVLGMLHLGNVTTATTSFYIRPAELAAQAEEEPFVAGTVLPVTVSNAGGVDAVVTPTLRLWDHYANQTVLLQASSGIVVPAASAVILSGTIPLGQASGRYRLKADGPYTPGNQDLRMARWVEVSGADVHAQAGGGLFIAGSSLPVTLTNDGSVDALTTYTLTLYEDSKPLVLGTDQDGVPVLAGQSVVVTGGLPITLASNSYLLQVSGTYTPGERPVDLTRWVEVSGADVVAQVPPGLYVADSEVSVSLINNGSVDAEVVYELWLRDRDSQVFLGENSSGVMVPAHATLVVTGTIPEGTRSGRYGLHVEGTYTPGERRVHKVQLVEVAGPEIALKGRTDRTLYLTSDNITVTANVTNTGAPLPEGDLELAIVRELPGAQAWEIYNTYNSELAYDTVSVVEVEAGGNVWFASTDGGYGPPELNRLLADLETWEYYYLPEPMGWASTVFEIVSDGAGQTWFATDAGVGVLSADRTTWTVYQEPDGEVITDGLLSNLVYAVAVDDAGNAWFGTDGGVNLLTSGGQWIDYTPSNSDLLSYQVYAVVLAGDGSVWFGTDEGLSHLLPDATWVNYTPDDSDLLGYEVVDIAIDGAGDLWLAVPGWSWGVSVLLSSGEWISYTTTNSGLTSGYVTAIDIDAYGRKWIGSDYDGVDVLAADGVTWKNYTPPTVSAFTINDVAPAPNGDVWLATEGYDEGGATRAFRSSEAWQVYNTYNSELAYDTVSAVEVDADGNVWFASSDGWYGPPELNRLWADLETWEYYYLPEPMYWASTVFEIVSDSVGQTWFATDAGVGVLSSDGTDWTVYQAGEAGGLLSNLVFAVAVDDAGNAWFGTDNGVSLLTSGGQWIDYTPSNSDLLSYQVYAVALDGDGGVWFGTDEGLSHLLPDDTWVNYTPDNSDLLGYEVVDIAVDGAGGLWLAVPGWNWGVGVLLSSGGWISYTTANSDLTSPYVNTIAVDADDRKWIGADGDGVDVLAADDAVWEHYDVPPLSGDIINDIAPAPNGDVWLATGSTGGGGEIPAALASITEGGGSGGATRYYQQWGEDQMLWRRELSVSLPTLATLEDVSSLIAGTLNATGRLILRATLTSSLDQLMASDRYPFYVFPTRVSLTLDADRALYQPGQTLVASGALANHSTLPLYGQWISVTLNGETVYTAGPFDLDPGQEQAYTVTTAAPLDEGQALLEATSPLISVNQLVRVAAPTGDATLSVPEVAGREPFSATVTVTNTGETDAIVRVAIAGGTPTWLVLEPGGSDQVDENLTINADTLLTATVRGDLNFDLSQMIQALVPTGTASLAAPPVAGREPFSATVTVTNTGETTLLVDVTVAGGPTRALALAPDQFDEVSQSVTINQDSVVTATVRGDLTFDLSQLVLWGEGAQVTLLAPDTDVSGAVVAPFTLRGTGELPTQADLLYRLDGSVVFSRTYTLWPGQVLSDSLVLDVSAGPHVLAADLLDQDGRLLDQDALDVVLLPDGEPLEPALRLLDVSATPNPILAGETLSVTLTVANDGPSGPALVGLQLFDPEQQWIITPTGWTTGSFTFNLAVPGDVPADTYFGEATLNTSSQPFTVDVVGRDIEMALALDQPLYFPGEVGELTVTLTEKAGVSGDYIVMSRYLGDEDYYTVTIPANQVIQHTFNFTATDPGRATVFLSNAPLPEVGQRVLNLDSLPVPVATPEWGAYLAFDKLVYDSGETVNMTVHVTGTLGDLTVMGPMELALLSENTLLWSPDPDEDGLGLVVTGTYPLSYTLPDDGRTGRYTFILQVDGESHSYPIDVRGWKVTTRHMTLNKAHYDQQDDLAATVEFWNEGQTPINGLRLQSWVFTPDDGQVFALSPDSPTLDLAVGLNVVTVAGTLDTPVVGPHRLLVNLVAPDGSWRVAGASAQFDVGWAHLVELTTDKGDYAPDEPGLGRLDVYGFGPTQLVVTATNGSTLLDAQADLLGFEVYTFTIPTADEGDYLLVARSTDQNGATDSLLRAYAVPPPQDTQAPELALTYPSTRTIVSMAAPTTTLTVTGQASDDSGEVTVLVNGQVVTPTTGGLFTTTLVGEQGLNTVSAVAMDPSSNLTFTPVIPVLLLPEYGVTLSADRSVAYVGQVMTFTIDLTSTGVLSDVLATLALPSAVVTDVVVTANAGQASVSDLSPEVQRALWNGDVTNAQPVEVNVAATLLVSSTLTGTLDVYWTGGLTDQDTVVVTVEAASENNAPLAGDDYAFTPQDTAVSIAVLDNDEDPDGDPLAVASLTQPAHGTAEINPDDSITYTPDTGFAGEDTFTYTAADGRGGSDTATVTVSVQALDDWQYGCQPSNLKLDVIGTGMGNGDAVLQNPATLTIENPDQVAFIVAQVVVNNYRGYLPEKVIVSSDQETHELLAPTNSDAGYNYEVFMQPSGQITAEVVGDGSSSDKTPRAFIAYVYRYSDGEGASNGRLVHTYVYHASHNETLSIPIADFARDVRVVFAVSDVQDDSRTVEMQAQAGGVSRSVTAVQPNRGEELLIYTVLLPDVPGDVDTVSVTLTSPSSNGDSLYWSGVNAVAPCQEVVSEGRVSENLQVLYDFQEGSGDVVHDVSGVGAALDLAIDNSAAVHWLSGGGLSIDTSTLIASTGAASKVIDAAQATDELSIEAWLKPANVTQDGPARIVTLSQDPSYRNFTLGQGRWGSYPPDVFDVRLRTTGTGNNGTPSLTSPEGTATTDLTHVIYTRDAAGVARIYLDGVQVVQDTVGGDLSNWNAGYALALGNELTGDRPWRGELHLVALYNRALTPGEVSQNYDAGPGTEPPPPPPPGTRVTQNLQVLYDFQEGSGDVVHDVSGVGAALDLAIDNSAAVHWLSGGGLSIDAFTLIASTGAASKVIDAAQATDELSIEAWLKPANVTQDGPARIVTLSQDPNYRNFTLGQGRWGSYPPDVFDVRLRTTGTGNNGTPSLTSPEGTATTDLTHVIYTRDAAGVTRIYLDGVQVVQDTVGGDLSNWNAGYALALGNELTEDRPWRGELHLVALYNRALTPDEVSQNYDAGPGTEPPPPPPPGTRVTQNLQVLYDFQEGSGDVVHDVSGVGAALDLAIDNSAAVHWLSGGGLSIDASTLIASTGAASKVIDAAQATDELSIEAWLKPANVTQDGPARIVTLSQDPNYRNFTLGQGRWGSYPPDVFDVRLRTTGTGNNGTPSLTSPEGTATTDLTHVIYTRDAAGVTRIYLDGVQVVQDTVGGDLSNWNAGYALALGNELTGDRPWRGELHLVALYNRALTPGEVSQNYDAGPGTTP